jgi:hypothetical protein
MKQTISLILLFISVEFLAAQIPQGWDTSPPRDTERIKYSVGVSSPLPTEQEALRDAFNDALRNFAASIGTQIRSDTFTSSRSEGYESGIEDVFTVTVEASTFSTQVRLSGVRELARKTETRGGLYVIRILTAMSMEDYQKALRYIENEEAAFLAYRFFTERKLPAAPLDPSGRPQNYPDFYSWLRNDCVVISVAGANGAAFMEPLEGFAKKLYRNCTVHAQNINRLPSRIIFNAPRYYDGIFRALEETKLFSIVREEGGIILTPLKRVGEFRAALNAMKDGSRIFVTGIELIRTEEKLIPNENNIIVNSFKTIAARRFGLTAVNYSVPAQYINGENLDEDGLIAHIRGSPSSFPARYIALCYSFSILEPGIAAYNIAPRVGASCRFVLYDMLTGEVYHSAAAGTAAIFTLGDNSAETVISESRRALQYLQDPKNSGGLEDIMANILEDL